MVNLASEQNAKLINQRLKELEADILIIKEGLKTMQNNTISFNQSVQNQSNMVQNLIQQTVNLKDELRSHINDNLEMD